MKRSLVAAFCVMVVLLAGLPGTTRADGWLVLGNTAWVSGDPTMILTNEYVLQPSVSVKVTQAGDLKWIATNIPFTFPQAAGNTIDAIVICYKTTSERTFISQTRLAEYLGLEGAVGLTNVLAGQAPVADALQQWGASGIAVLPSGSVPPNPSDHCRFSLAVF